MNIYFAGSIRGGRQDAEKYHRIVEHLVQHFINCSALISGYITTMNC